MILFLDIDGVLNSTRSFIALKNNGDRNSIDPVAVGLVNRVLLYCDTLVLSSSHRKFFCSVSEYGSSTHLKELENYLISMGIKLPLYFSITENDNTSSHRGNQVHNWIVKYNINNSKYVILDDSTDFYNHQPLVKVDPDNGFSFSNYREALKLLGREDTNVFL